MSNQNGILMGIVSGLLTGGLFFVCFTALGYTQGVSLLTAGLGCFSMAGIVSWWFTPEPDSSESSEKSRQAQKLTSFTQFGKRPNLAQAQQRQQRARKKRRKSKPSFLAVIFSWKRKRK